MDVSHKNMQNGTIWRPNTSIHREPTPGEKSFEEELVSLGMTKTVNGKNIIWDERGPITWQADNTKPVLNTTASTSVINPSYYGTVSVTSAGNASFITTEGNTMYQTFDKNHQVDSLKKDIEAMKAAQARLIEESERLKKHNDNQSHNYAQLEAEYSKLTKAHNELRDVLKDMPDTANTHQLLDGYRKTVAELQRIIEDKNDQIDYLEDVNGDMHDLLSDAQDAAEELRNEPIPDPCSDWDKLTLEEKTAKLNAGITVWSASTGHGPLRALLSSATKLQTKEQTFGMVCRDHLGRDKVYPVADLVPARPNMRPRPSKLNLFASTLAASAGVAFLAYPTFGFKGVVAAGLTQTALALIHMREYAKV